MRNYLDALGDALSTAHGLKLDWQFHPYGGWWSFDDLDAAQVAWRDIFGIYIVAANDGRTIRLGQGDVVPRLRVHKNDRSICNPSFGSLWITCASVGRMCVSGVERFLANELSPVVGEAFPDVGPIPVNLPTHLLTSHQRLVRALMKQNSPPGGLL
jgi:hypothetical protein